MVNSFFLEFYRLFLKDVFKTCMGRFHLSEITLLQNPYFKTSDEIPQEMSAPPTERSTPIKPEDIPGAVRVFPMPMMSSAASGSHWKHRDGRSASVDMNGYGKAF